MEKSQPLKGLSSLSQAVYSRPVRPIRLVQLVSEQTMQNVLPMLALRPCEVVNLYTAPYANRLDWMKEAVREAGFEPGFENVRLSAMPDMTEVYRAANEHVAVGDGVTPIVNFTGGTKLMSIGAYAAATTGKILSLYVDTQQRRFVDGVTCKGRSVKEFFDGGDMSFASCCSCLDLKIVSLANGHEGLSSGLDWRSLAPAARHLLNNSADRGASKDAVIVFYKNGKEPRGNDLAALAGEKISLPEPVAKLMKSSDLLEVEGRTCLFPRTRDRRRLQKGLDFFIGTWWEVAVVDRMESSGCFRDIRWSADVGHVGGRGALEEDVLALKLNGVEVVYVSCKMGLVGDKLLGHLEEISSRAERVGGKFTRKYLALHRPLEGAHRNDVEKRARELEIRIVTPGNLDDIFQDE